MRPVLPVLLLALGAAPLAAAPADRTAARAAERAAAGAAPLAAAATGAAASAAARAAGSEADAWVERTLASLTLREKAAQMVMPWIPGGLSGAELRRAERLVRTERVGGFVVGKGGLGPTRAALARLQRASRVPLLMAADLEWGAGMRLAGATVFPVAMAIGATGVPAYAYEVGYATAVEGRIAGLHVALAPVADVNSNPANPIINTRSFGEDPGRVGEFVAAFVRGVQDGGMLAVAKHFPGHGDTDTDSHLALPVVHASRARLDSLELVPFRSAIDAGVAGIMAAHIALPALTGRRPCRRLARRGRASPRPRAPSPGL